MPDEHPFHQGPQRRAIPRMALFLGALVVLAVLVLFGFSLAA